MIGRNRHYGRKRQGSLKAKIGIATAVLVAGGAIGVVVASTSHSPTAASSTGYVTSTPSSGTLLNEALSTSSSATSDKLLVKLASVKNFAEFTVHGKVLAIQRGIVVLATKKFVIVRSKNGALKLWWLSSGTKFHNVAKSPAGTAALTASPSAASAAKAGNLVPAVNTVSSKATAAALLTPVSATKTLTVTDAATGTTVKVLITKSTAVVITKTSKTTSKIVENAFTSVNWLRRADLTLVFGLHASGALHAQQILFVPLFKSDLK
jgi:hypothetical protein